jgi:hypothetical protein
MIPVVVAVVKNQTAPAISTSMIRLANAIAVMFLDVAQESTMTMIHVIVSVKRHQHATLHTTTIQAHVNASVDHMIAMLVNTLTQRPVAVNAQSTKPAKTINTSMVQLASVNAVT